MKRVLTIATALLLAAAPALAQNQYGWSISASSTDPNVNIAPISPGLPASIYLWLNCSTGGASGAEFAVSPVGLLGLSFSGSTGVLNATAYPHLSLGLGGCQNGPFLAGTIGVLNLGAGGTVCLIPAAATGNYLTVDCATPVPAPWPHTQVGFSTGAPPPCVEVLCPIVSVEESSWGSVKSLYR